MNDSGGSRGGARGGRPPTILFLDQTEARRAEIIFFVVRASPPPLSKGLHDPPPPSQGLYPALNEIKRQL